MFWKTIIILGLMAVKTVGCGSDPTSAPEAAPETTAAATAEPGSTDCWPTVIACRRKVSR